MIVGKYTYVSGENIEAFFKAMKTPEDMIATAVKMSSSDFEILMDGDKYVIDNGHRKLSFKSGEEFEEKWGDHSGTMKVTVIDDNTMEREITTGSGSKAKDSWKFSEDGIKIVQTAVEGDVKATRTFKRA
eukprot:TCALIF_06031-PA protein Name:"Protein of unknown function" AED:0.01 eAED:0.02 QI:0/-1/0/1/-1/1/1/0/129